MRYTLVMIRSFRHRGLQEFHETGSSRGVRPDHSRKLARILDALETASSPHDMNFPGFGLHPLKGCFSGCWAVSVSGNWRVIFSFDGVDAVNVDYLDYH